MYRPTSKDAIAKMLSGVAVCTLDIPGPFTSDSDSAPEVGKGLNVKGKSAKKGARAPPGRPGPPSAALLSV